ncbi:MAG TPA: T9SS type A sorting domain-containing protein [Lentimicrobium sp.]|nr:T9SS type A sorting domain-containing protein [Lentimicrobium sp.]
MKHFYLLLLFVVTVFRLSAQDTLTVMHYNLLNYGNYTEYCTNSNNNHFNKEGYLRTILDYISPQILTVNEISNLNFYHERLLNEVLNTDGRSTYKRAPATNTAGSDIINMLYYDTTILSLKSTTVIQSLVRDVDLYRLYFKNAAKLANGDTIYINCIIAHLKAGDSNQDEVKRGEMASNVINWLKDHAQPGNYLLMGDFNLYTSNEPAYQTFTGVSADDFIFYDPLNMPGSWNNNPLFASIHTQSVSNSGSGCQAGGGLDDRFDFILASDYIMEGSDDVIYKSGSYKAIGQDGLHFNQSVTNLPNNSVPSDVLDALGKMSDHLPVKLTLEVNAELPESIPENDHFNNFSVYPLSGTEAVLQFDAVQRSSIEIRIYSIMGQLLDIKHQESYTGKNKLKIDLKGLQKGFYLIVLSDNAGNSITVKFIKS